MIKLSIFFIIISSPLYGIGNAINGGFSGGIILSDKGKIYGGGSIDFTIAYTPFKEWPWFWFSAGGRLYGNDILIGGPIIETGINFIFFNIGIGYCPIIEDISGFRSISLFFGGVIPFGYNFFMEIFYRLTISFENKPLYHEIGLTFKGLNFILK